MIPLAFCAVLWYIKSSMNSPEIGQKHLLVREKAAME